MKSVIRVLSATVTAVIVALPGSLSAHFKLLEPASWLIEDERGDP